MRQVTLGRTNEKVSAISLGSWSYGSTNVVDGRSVGWSDHDDHTAKHALIRAWELGITHWDTADAYGNGRAEQLIGDTWNTVPRHEIFLATKVGWVKAPNGQFYQPAHMRHQLERSLKNLRTDVVDLYYLHHCLFGDHGGLFDAALETITRFKQEGKIRYIGLSDWEMPNILTYVDRVNPDVIQPYRNVMDDDYVTSGLKDWVDRQNVGIAFFSPLKHGLLTGKYTEPTQFPLGDFRATVAEFHDASVIRKMRERRRAIENKFASHPHPLLHGLLDSLFADAPTGCVLVGLRNPEQVEAAASTGDRMRAEDAEWVRALYQT